MAIQISDDFMALEASGAVIATARFSRYAAADGNGAWIVSTCPARQFGRSQAVTALALVGRLAAGYGHDDPFVMNRRTVRAWTGGAVPSHGTRRLACAARGMQDSLRQQRKDGQWTPHPLDKAAAGLLGAYACGIPVRPLRENALQVDGALCILGAGAGNSPTEVLVATFERLGIPTGVDVQGALAAAQEVVRPFLSRMPFADRGAITQGYAGVYSSFLLHAARRPAVRRSRPRDPAAGRRGRHVGGQEDMIIDVALQILRQQETMQGWPLLMR